MWQRQTEIYAAVVRLPDRPHLRLGEQRVELIPGENHWETRGYHLLLNSRKVREALVVPGESFELTAAGTYTAVAVEWSGLQSVPSLPLQLAGTAKLTVLKDAPGDFQWTSDRWLSSAGQPISAAQASSASEAIKEIVHLHDGVIHRQTWRQGKIAQQDDLNADGKPIRRQTYEGGKLATRQFLDAGGNLVSTEWFDADGHITRSLGQRSHTQGLPAWKRDGSTNLAEWHYDRGAPIRYRRGSASYVKEGDRWVAKP
jgi:hypothetical protein